VSHGLLLQGKTVTNLDDHNAANHSTFCTGINTAGQIVCSYTDSGGLYHGAMWSNGTFTEITFAAEKQVEALGIDDAGDIAGVFIDSTGGEHAYLLAGGVNGTLTQLDAPGATYSFGYGINETAGKITVTVIWGDTNGNAESSVYDATTMTYTKRNAPVGDNVFIHGINSSGNVVYSVEDTNGNFHGALFENGSYYLLDVGNSSSTYADGITGSNLIVGPYFPTGSSNAEGFKGMK
jgi:hypothetical protein